MLARAIWLRAFSTTLVLLASASACRHETRLGASSVELPSTGIPGVTVSGTPSAGQILTATDSSNATWQTGSAPGGSAGGDLSGTYPNPTVAKVNGKAYPASLAQGDVLYYNGTSVTNLGAGTSGQALVTAGAAANPAWGTNFGANALTTTGTLSVGSTPAASTGLVRLPGGTTTQLAFRNNANSADRALIATDTSDGVTFGNSSGATTIQSSSPLSLIASGGTAFSIFNGAVTVGATLGWSGTFGAGKLFQNAPAANGATVSFLVAGQPANASSTSNKNGGFVTIQGGSRTDTAGKRGGVRLALNGANTTESTEVLVEAADVQPSGTVASRVVSLCRNAAITTTEMPTNTGDLVVYIGNAAVLPSANPVSGGILYVDSGALKYRGSSGTVTTLGVP